MYSSTSRWVKNAALAIFASCSLLGINAQAQQKSVDNSIISMERNNVDNTPKIIRFSPSAGWKAGQAQEIFKKYLGMDGVNTTMQLKYSTTTKSNVTAERYSEVFKGVPVEYGGYTLTIKNGKVEFITGNYYDMDANIPATPQIAEGVAFGYALAYVGAQKYMWQDPASEQVIKNRYRKDTSYLPHGQLEWIEDYTTNNGVGDRQLHLAYSFDIYAVQPVSRQKVFVDATSGKILHSNSMIKHTAASGHSLYSGVVPFQTSYVGGTYELFDSTRGNGVHTQNLNNGTTYGAATQFTSASNTWPSSVADTTALDAHWGGERVYDYWDSVQGRLSWDNLNGVLLQYVHYSTNYDNAFWDGTEMNYGDGSGCAAGGFTSLTSLDVTAHEIGHGVCQATCNLVYGAESGGIDEGLSDCWGATIENWANPHEVDAVPKKTWWMGEEIGCGTPLRRLDSPKLYGLPDTYLGINWYSVTGCTPGTGNDECGVHTNMGVLSKWYYLLTVGATGTNDLGNVYTVAGQGFTVSQNILYQTELVLASNVTYPDFRTTSISVATTLYGACSPQVQAVTDAWYAVGVGAAFVPCTPQIGFTVTALDTTEYAATTSCPASKVINIGVKPIGPAITGGNPVVNVVVGSGTAVAGVDYVLSSSTLTFIAGDTSIQYATLTLYDNGAINDSKNLVLGLTLTAAGSDATISATADSMYINITNDDNAPLLGGPEYHTLNTGTAVTCNNTSAFFGSRKKARTQFLLYASELTAAGVKPGVPITQIAFNITTKNSTAAFTGYTISMANTTLTDMTTAFATPLTQVYTGNHTTNLGLDSLDFTTNFVWDGTSNVAVQACFGVNAAAFSANDQMSGIQQPTAIVTDYNSSSSAAGGSGCTSLNFSTTNQSTARPVMRFKQIVPATPIETVLASTKTWDVKSGTEVYFYNPSDTNLIAGLKNQTNDLGCVSTTVTGAGNGLTPAVFSSMNRSRKEVTITPTINGATTTYDATIYLNTTELAGTTPSTLYLLKTDAATDAAVNASNTVIVTPTLITGTNYVGFQGHFTGFSRFFLVDGPVLCTPPAATITPAGPTTFCLGSNVTLNANTGTGYTYQWQLGGTAITGATNSSYVAANGGAYTVVITQTGCSGTSSATTITVDSAYAAPITAAGGTTVCTGQSITLTDVTSSGVWQSSDNTVATVSTSGVVTGVDTVGGTVTISYTATNSCGPATATISVTVNASPIVSPITGTTTLCAGTSVVLTGDAAPGAWSSSDTTIASVDASGNLTGVAGGSAVISYTVTNAAGCTTSATTTVTILAAPAATITPVGSTTFCTGGSVVLNANTGTGLTYQWQSAGVNITGATNSSYTATTSDNITLVVTNTNNCSTTSSALITTESGSFVVVPAVAIAATPGTLVCTGSGPVSFSATPTNGGPAPTYQWSVNGTTVGAGAGYTYTPADGDVVSCVMTSNAACATPDTAVNSVSMTVSAYVMPSVSISTASGDTACTGVPTTFVAVPVNGGTTPSYVWTKNGINVATGATYTYVPSTGDVVVCTMTSSYPCRTQDTAVSSALTMVVEAPTANTVSVTASSSSIVSGQTVTFTANAPHAGTSPVYVWFVNGVVVPGATSATYTTDTLVNGQIVTCEVTSSEPCAAPHTNMSSGITVLVTNGVQNVNNLNSFMLIPNPNKGTFIIKGNIGAADNLTVKITDVLGQVVYTQTLQIHNGVVNEQVVLGSSLANGVYLINITSPAGSNVYHMVLDK